ncbi:hypothetical protein [Longimicrobium terrae]|uniref:Uncharacterized protein n=1 Tax=Longimicrobium terrae TaxID=1639882 RepID=A0A841GZ71_9BACT|nr:hypothetical protein [Longimicrobium terrae]MBB4636910.1 hypothetical protein [Longimicrobium terrae]MBB6071091.1 hypothetical protein [Longimicrobium terrae]NNC29142.1 hypothetical protein [Longimicrobium terrae]
MTDDDRNADNVIRHRRRPEKARAVDGHPGISAWAKRRPPGVRPFLIRHPPSMCRHGAMTVRSRWIGFCEPSPRA